MKIRKYRYFVGDFETTTYKGQVRTEVWASACVEMFTEDVKVFHSIEEQFEYFKSLNCNICCYYHNLKFDGAFWLDYLMTELEYEQAIWTIKNNENGTVRWRQEKYMNNRTFKYSISAMGQWYSITIKVNNHIIELRDSLKLLPFSVKKIGKSFGTKHHKLDMEYTGFRYAGCEITDEEQEYIKNDVLVVKEALEIMFTQGHDKLTIGSCCLAEYKHLLGKGEYNTLFPDVYSYPLDADLYGQPNAGEYIRKSYKGGWCYVVKGKSKQIKHNGITADVNSLYPSMMSSESGNRYPIGLPTFWYGNYIPDEALQPDKYYFVRLTTRFYLKPGKLPFIQIKGSIRYRANECLESSDIYYNGEYHSHYIDFDGETTKPATVTLTLTMTDYELFKEHYYLVDPVIISGCYFDSQIGIFDTYIEKYKKIKMESKGAIRELAKLFLNNLYGKMATNQDSSFKFAYLKDDKTVGFYIVKEQEKKAGYIPVGSAITSYARNFTIRAAQKNYYGVDNRGFIYADTDSIHCDLTADEVKGITVHPTNFCCWKLESYWDEAIFTRQKTYIEHITHEDGEPVEPRYTIKCAGMPESCKELFLKSMTMTPIELQEIISKPNKTEADLYLLQGIKNLNDFDIGLEIPGKLMPKHIRGGTVLQETTYKMRAL